MDEGCTLSAGGELLGAAVVAGDAVGADAGNDVAVGFADLGPGAIAGLATFGTTLGPGAVAFGTTPLAAAAGFGTTGVAGAFGTMLVAAAVDDGGFGADSDSHQNPAPTAVTRATTTNDSDPPERLSTPLRSLEKSGSPLLTAVAGMVGSISSFSRRLFSSAFRDIAR